MVNLKDSQKNVVNTTQSNAETHKLKYLKERMARVKQRRKARKKLNNATAAENKIMEFDEEIKIDTSILELETLKKKFSEKEKLNIINKINNTKKSTKSLVSNVSMPTRPVPPTPPDAPAAPVPPQAPTPPAAPTITPLPTPAPATVVLFGQTWDVDTTTEIILNGFGQYKEVIPPSSPFTKDIGYLVNLKEISISNQPDTWVSTIPKEIGLLGKLTNLTIQNCPGLGIDSSIPKAISALSGLQRLTIDTTGFQGEIPREFGLLTSLTTLELEYNNLTGSIPAELGNLIGLQYLWLDGNKLTGEIPRELGLLTSLKQISLGSNRHTGSIPAELGNLTGLRKLALNDNGLSDSIPEQIGLLTNLQDLDLIANKLTGEIPRTLGHLEKLLNLKLSENQLTGRIPAELGNIKGNIRPVSDSFGAGYKSYWFGGNQFTGPIPPAFFLIGNDETSGTRPNPTTGLSLNLNDNNLTGSLPKEIAYASHLKKFRVHNNKLSGNLPEEMELIKNTFEPKTENEYAGQFHFWNFSSNNFTGSIRPAVRGIARKDSYWALVFLGYPYWVDVWMALTSLRCSDNNFTGQIPNVDMLKDWDSGPASQSEFPSSGTCPYWELDSCNAAGNKFTGLLSSIITQFGVFRNDTPKNNTNEFTGEYKELSIIAGARRLNRGFLVRQKDQDGNTTFIGSTKAVSENQGIIIISEVDQIFDRTKNTIIGGQSTRPSIFGQRPLVLAPGEIDTIEEQIKNDGFSIFPTAPSTAGSTDGWRYNNNKFTSINTGDFTTENMGMINLALAANEINYQDIRDDFKEDIQFQWESDTRPASEDSVTFDWGVEMPDLNSGASDRKYIYMLSEGSGDIVRINKKTKESKKWYVDTNRLNPQSAGVTTGIKLTIHKGHIWYSPTDNFVSDSTWASISGDMVLAKISLRTGKRTVISTYSQFVENINTLIEIPEGYSWYSSWNIFGKMGFYKNFAYAFNVLSAPVAGEGETQMPDITYFFEISLNDPSKISIVTSVPGLSQNFAALTDINIFHRIFVVDEEYMYFSNPDTTKILKTIYKIKRSDGTITSLDINYGLKTNASPQGCNSALLKGNHIYFEHSIDGVIIKINVDDITNPVQESPASTTALAPVPASAIVYPNNSNYTVAFSGIKEYFQGYSGNFFGILIKIFADDNYLYAIGKRTITQFPVEGKLPTSNICFPAGTPIKTDQGLVAIEKINTDFHTIDKQRIVDVTKTKTSDAFLVKFKKHALAKNYPSEDTVMSQKHKVLYKGKMCEAKSFLGAGFKKVEKVSYNGEVLYNVLLDKHGVMGVNGMVCETLHPEHVIAKLFSKKSKYSVDQREDILSYLDMCRKKNFSRRYRNIIKNC